MDLREFLPLSFLPPVATLLSAGELPIARNLPREHAADRMKEAAVRGISLEPTGRAENPELQNRFSSYDPLNPPEQLGFLVAAVESTVRRENPANPRPLKRNAPDQGEEIETIPERTGERVYFDIENTRHEISSLIKCLMSGLKEISVFYKEPFFSRDPARQKPEIVVAHLLNLVVGDSSKKVQMHRLDALIGLIKELIKQEQIDDAFLFHLVFHILNVLAWGDRLPSKFTNSLKKFFNFSFPVQNQRDFLPSRELILKHTEIFSIFVGEVVPHLKKIAADPKPVENLLRGYLDLDQSQCPEFWRKQLPYPSLITRLLNPDNQPHFEPNTCLLVQRALACQTVIPHFPQFCSNVLVWALKGLFSQKKKTGFPAVVDLLLNCMQGGPCPFLVISVMKKDFPGAQRLLQELKKTLEAAYKENPGQLPLLTAIDLQLILHFRTQGLWETVFKQLECMVVEQPRFVILCMEILMTNRELLDLNDHPVILDNYLKMLHSARQSESWDTLHSLYKFFPLFFQPPINGARLCQTKEVEFLKNQLAIFTHQDGKRLSLKALLPILIQCMQANEQFVFKDLIFYLLEGFSMEFAPPSEADYIWNPLTSLISKKEFPFFAPRLDRLVQAYCMLQRPLVMEPLSCFLTSLATFDPQYKREYISYLTRSVLFDRISLLQNEDDIFVSAPVVYNFMTEQLTEGYRSKVAQIYRELISKKRDSRGWVLFLTTSASILKAEPMNDFSGVVKQHWGFLAFVFRRSMEQLPQTEHLFCYENFVVLSLQLSRKEKFSNEDEARLAPLLQGYFTALMKTTHNSFSAVQRFMNLFVEYVENRGVKTPLQRGLYFPLNDLLRPQIPLATKAELLKYKQQMEFLRKQPAIMESVFQSFIEDIRKQELEASAASSVLRSKMALANVLS